MGLVRNPEPARRVSRPVAEPSPSPSRHRDRQLVDTFRDGDERAFEELVHFHRRRLFVIAFRRVGDVEAAEDAVQITLTKAYHHLPRMSREIDVGAWLSAVVQNAAVDVVRGDARQRRLAGRAFAAAPERRDRKGSEKPAGPKLSRLERYELGKILHGGILALPAPYRRPLVLFYLHGLSVEDVANVLELNVNTVKSHLARGRGHLRRRLGPRLTRGAYL